MLSLRMGLGVGGTVVCMVLLAAGCNELFGVKTLKKMNRQEPNALCSTPDDGAVVVGLTDVGNPFSEDGVEERMYIVRVDSRGDIIWERTIGEEGINGTVLDVVAASNGGYVALGMNSEWTTTERIESVVFRFDDSGEEIWRTVLDDTDGSFRSLVATQDGGYLAVGNWYTEEGDGARVARIDVDGVVLWEETYIFEDKSVYFNDVTQTSDGDFVFVGSQWGRTVFDSDGFLFRIDSEGELLWSKSFGNPDIDDFFRSVTASSEGAFVAAGHRGIDYFGTPDDPDVIRNAWVVKFDSEGNVEWERVHGGEAEDQANSIEATADGGYVFSGLTRSYDFQNNDAWIVKLDSEGHMEWQVNHPGTATIAEAYDVHQTQDGTFIATGKILNLVRNWDIFVMRLDVNGEM